MSPIRTVAVASAALAVAVVSACSSPGGSSDNGTTGSQSPGQSGPPHSGGHLTVALAEAPDILDPTQAQTYVGRIVFANMCEKLYDIDENLNIVPQLAAGMPTISAGGKTVTIKLRTGVKFNDGTPFDAQAVKQTLERDKTAPKSSRGSELSVVKKIDVVDPATVKLTLTTPYAPLTAILADRSGMIESPAQLKKLGKNFGQHPVCVGPFSFDSRPSSDQINLVKSQFYYDKDKVNLDKVSFEVVTQPNVRAANVRSGDVDLAGRIRPNQIKALQNDSKVALQQVTSLGYQGITINVSNSNGAAKPPFDVVSTPLAKSAQLRQAFALSLDRDTINQVVWNGQYVPDCTPISPDSPFAPGITCPKQDIAKAKQLVQQSGVSTPIKVTLVVQAANSDAAKLGQVVQSMTKPVGFDVKVTPTEFTAALSAAQAGKFDAFQIGWSGRIDPDQNISQFWSPDSTLNYSGANYPDITSLIAQARATNNQATRKADYSKLAQMFLQKDNIIYLWHEKLVLAMGKNVHGVQFFGDGMIRLKTASVG